MISGVIGVFNKNDRVFISLGILFGETVTLLTRYGHINNNSCRHFKECHYSTSSCDCITSVVMQTKSPHLLLQNQLF